MINSAFYLYPVQYVSERKFALGFCYYNLWKKELKYKASKMWNQLPSSLNKFFLVKYFCNKLKFLQVCDNLISVFLSSVCLCNCLIAIFVAILATSSDEHLLFWFS